MSNPILAQSDCIFCLLLNGAEPASFVYRDEFCAAFMDIQPVNPGHLLIVPLIHASSLETIDSVVMSHLMGVAHRLAAALRNSGIRCEGVNLSLADGEAAGQEVFHVHLHLFPRYSGDGFGLHFGPHYTKLPRTELDESARQIRRALGLDIDEKKKTG
jgi:histidine triad (HIT) family protein